LRPPIAKVSANLKIHDPKVTRRLGDDITFVIHIPLSIDLLLDLRLDKQRFVVSGDIALRAAARAAEPLLLRILAGVDGEIRRFVAAYVAEEIDSPQSQAAQVIDVAHQLAQAWPWQAGRTRRSGLYVRRRRVCQCNARDRLTRSDNPWLE
jgi:hypothetical protein